MNNKYTLTSAAIVVGLILIPAPTEAQSTNQLSSMLDQARTQLMGMLDSLNGGGQDVSEDATASETPTPNQNETESDTDDSVVTTDQLDEKMQNLRELIRKQSEAQNDADSNTTYDAGSGISLSSDNVFNVNDGAGSFWNQNGGDLYYNSGKVGVGTSSPNRTFQVSGTVTLDGDGDGSNDSVFINSDDIGNNCISIGGTVTDGGYCGNSMAIGKGAQVGGKGTTYFNTAVGHDSQIGSNTQRAIRSVAVGRKAFARSSGVVVVGEQAEAGGRSVVVGKDSQANASDSIVIGQRTRVNGDNSAAIGGSTGNAGIKTTVDKDNTFAYGHNLDNSDGGPTAHGFGTTSPDYRLHVATSSDGAVAGFTDTNGTCTVDPTSTSLSCSSDERLKDDISKLSSASVLNNIQKLSAVTYRWDSQEEGKQYGFVAQDVEDVYPQFVSEGPNGYKKISYSSFIPVAIEGIKQLDLRLDEVETGTTSVEQLTNDDSFVKKVATAVTDILKQGTQTFQTLVAQERVRAPELCAGSTCVTENQLKKLLQKNSVAHNSHQTYESVTSTHQREEDSQGEESDEQDQQETDTASSTPNGEAATTTPQSDTAATSTAPQTNASSTNATSTSSTEESDEEVSTSTAATNNTDTGTSTQETSAEGDTNTNQPATSTPPTDSADDTQAEDQAATSTDSQ